MSHYKVTPEGVRNAKDTMLGMTQNIGESFEEMMDALSKIDEVLVNSKTEELVRILSIRKMNFLSARANLNKAVNNLEIIAAEYESAERDNIDELHSID